MPPNSNVPHIGDYWLSATEVADILWLAALMSPPLTATVPESAVTAHDEAEEQPSADSGEVGDTQQAVQSIPDGKAAETPTPGQAKLEPDYHTPEPTAAVYTGGQTEDIDDPDVWGGVGFKAPRAPAILEKAAIMRSLRPLQRHIPSTRHFILHEAETSERIAAALLGRGSWLPARYPAPERWLDLVVLVDGAPSMALWQQTVEEFVTLLSNIGIFRNVQRWTLAVVEVEGAVNDEHHTELHLYPAPSASGSTSRRRNPTELLDQQRRRLFLVVSDCSSIVWDSGAAQRLLQPLAAHNLVSLIQVLPEELWSTTALGLAQEVRLTTSRALSANMELLTGQKRRDGSCPIPVVSLEPEPLHRWAGFLAGRERRSVVGYYLPAITDVTIDVDQALLDLGITPLPATETREVSIDDLYDRFRERVPQRARPLAAYFAAAPLTLPVMRMVQAALLRHTTHADFVRVFYSGLLQRTTALTVERDDSDIVYDFVGGDAMREFLLTRLPRYSAEQVVNLVIAELSRYVQEHLDQLASFDAVIAVRGAQGALHVDATAQYFAEVTTKVLRYLGGVYATLADNLEQYILPQPPLDEAQLAAQAEAQAVALEKAAAQSWQRLQETAVSLLAAAGESEIHTTTTQPEPWQAAPPVLQTRLRPDGDSQVMIPTAASRELRYAHESGVKTFVELRTQALALWQGMTRPGLAAPGDAVTLPHIITGEPLLKIEWCWIPGGKFQMGSRDYDREKPIHDVHVEGFWLARYPVTNEQYRQFMEAGGYVERRWWIDAGWQARLKEKWTEPRYWQDEKWNGTQQPVVGVSWYEAAAFCAWAAEATGEKIRLPTEAEWEKGARGTDGRPFPWGKAEPDAKLCNFNSNVGQTTPVGQYSPQGDSPYGCADMAGNVWDWTADWFQPYPGNNKPSDDYGEKYRVVRGGSWYDSRNDVRCANRNWDTADGRNDNVGFRCASTAF